MRNAVQYLLVLVLAFTTSLSYAQGKLISGTVLDDTGMELPGVSILEKGTTNGTVTSIDGKFQINVGKNAVIVVSFIGFETQQITIGDKTNLDIVMASDMQQLDQVVVVGYAKKNIKDVTGAIVSVKAEELAKSPVANFDQALAGRMAGVQVMASDGTPGSGMQIVIRGGNSVTGDNSPLYVIDGIPMENFDAGTINTGDIESFDVLKDASATAIYGSRGANGVVIINTKGGKAGPTRINVRSSVGVQWVPNRVDVMGAYDFVKLQEEVAVGQGGSYLESFKEHWVDPELYRDAKSTNWQDKIFREAIIQNHNVSMSGGNEKTKHYASLDFMNQEGTMIHTGYKKYNGSLKLNHNLTDKIKIGFNVNYSHIKQEGETVSGSNRVSILKDAISFRPVDPVNDDGMEGGVDPDDRNNLRFNPVKTLANTDRIKELDVFRSSITADFELVKGLTLRMNGGYVTDQRRESLFQGKDTYEGTYGIKGINGRLTDRRYYILSSSNVLNYKKSLSGGHKFDALIGQEMSSKTYDSFESANTLMPIGSLGIDGLELGTAPLLPVSYKGKSTIISYFSRLDYTFREKYLFTATMRADGSSRFLGDNKWGYFPAVSLGWRLIEESFIKDLNFFSNLKLRAGWGETGNNKVGDYSAFSQMGVSEYSGYEFGGSYQKGVEHQNVADKNLKWETTTQYNLGMDASFFNDRLSLTLDLYKKNTKDLLINADLAPSTGFNSAWRNIGEVENKGLEFGFTSRNIENENFKWSTSFNISFNRNKCIALNDGQADLPWNADYYFKYSEYEYLTRVGQPVGQIYGLISEGLYQVDDFNYENGTGYVLKDGIADNGNKQVIPGAVKFKDLNHDGTINEKDRTVIGNPLPKHFGGITNNFSYKGFDLSIFFQWSYGNDVLNANRIDFENPELRSNYNYYASVADRYTPNNPTNDIHIIRGENNILGGPAAGNLVSTSIVEDGSFIRLKTVSLGYNFNKNLLKKTMFNKARVYASGQNLFTWTKYTGFDPEVSVGKYGALTPGLDYSAYPISSTVTFGVELGF
ncbi:TonB-dependent receptor [Labilibaculum sp.]|uniref:SusC/RagA family TonB-linked outer membrane protein n=1 Tax=Labilibaculum sp. TaxID=2060723 RepID=UPI002AA6A979|nr:TonB-dependent receptor [Labilibaculum sp.]